MRTRLDCLCSATSALRLHLGTLPSVRRAHSSQVGPDFVLEPASFCAKRSLVADEQQTRTNHLGDKLYTALGGEVLNRPILSLDKPNDSGGNPAYYRRSTGI